jgi:hypothetical protein
MRTRAARLWMAIALAATVAAGFAGAPPAARAVVRDVSRTAAVPAQAAAAVGLSGFPHVAHAHKRAPAADVVLVPAALLTIGLVAWVVVRRQPHRRVLVPARAHARAPPVRWQ